MAEDYFETFVKSVAGFRKGARAQNAFQDQQRKDQEAEARRGVLEGRQDTAYEQSQTAYSQSQEDRARRPELAKAKANNERRTALEKRLDTITSEMSKVQQAVGAAETDDAMASAQQAYEMLAKQRDTIARQLRGVGGMPIESDAVYQKRINKDAADVENTAKEKEKRKIYDNNTASLSEVTDEIDRFIEDNGGNVDRMDPVARQELSKLEKREENLQVATGKVDPKRGMKATDNMRDKLAADMAKNSRNQVLAGRISVESVEPYQGAVDAYMKTPKGQALQKEMIKLRMGPKASGGASPEDKAAARKGREGDSLFHMWARNVVANGNPDVEHLLRSMTDQERADFMEFVETFAPAPESLKAVESQKVVNRRAANSAVVFGDQPPNYGGK